MTKAERIFSTKIKKSEILTDGLAETFFTFKPRATVASTTLLLKSFILFIQTTREDARFSPG